VTKTGVVALHYQNEVLHPDGKIRLGVAEGATGRDQVIERAARLLAGARAAGVPVVSVRIAFRPDHADVLQNARIFRDVVRLGAMTEGSWGAEFLDGLGPAPGEFVVTHNRIGAFHGSNLGDILRVLGVDRLIVAGVATSSVVVTTVAQAVDLGYEVIVAQDACSAARAEMHSAALDIMSIVAEVASVEDALSRL
jgi:nicotinamidase-related amidase